MYSFGRAALLLLVEVQNHTVPVRERRRIRVKQPVGDWQGHYHHVSAIEVAYYKKYGIVSGVIDRIVI